MDTSAMPMRPETDSLGEVCVEMDRLWGAQTERGRRLFDFGWQRMPLEIVHALADIKSAAAEVNRDLGLLNARKAGAISAAARRVAGGELDAHFPLPVWQTGSGTQTHMNVNEVIANVASVALGGGLGALRVVHPHDDVNLGQSSNDVFPSAMHLAVLHEVKPLLRSLARLRAALRAKADMYGDVPKIGRTHLQDAVPLTFGQEFGGYDVQLSIAEDAVRGALPAVRALAIGGTAVGTGINTHPEFGRHVIALLARRWNEPLVVAGSLFAALAGHEPLVALHGSLRTLAVALNKIACDIRLMGSGPRAGLGEIRLPANEPGSSIMPGKVNPTQVEALTMVCTQVMGHDVAVGVAASQGQFELNVYRPLIAHNLLDSLILLAGAMNGFAAHCVEGLTVDVERAAELLGRSLMLVTALTPHIGHDRAARIARYAQANDVTLRAAALEVDEITAAEFDEWVTPARMLGRR